MFFEQISEKIHKVHFMTYIIDSLKIKEVQAKEGRKMKRII